MSKTVPQRSRIPAPVRDRHTADHADRWLTTITGTGGVR